MPVHQDPLLRKLTVADIAAMIDHSLLRPDITAAELQEGFALALSCRPATVCVRPLDIGAAVGALVGSSVRVSSTIGFPHGGHATEVKAFEANKAIDLGASELDMVVAIGRLKSNDLGYVARDIQAVVEAAHARSAIVKVILETCYLTAQQIVEACKICEDARADYVKTSTGYSPNGATLDVVRLMRASCGPGVSVKAAGGIRALGQLLQFRAAGARMIGTRSTKAILEEAEDWEARGTLAEVAL